MARIEAVTFYEDTKPVGSVSVRGGALIFSDARLERRLRSKTVVDPTTREPVTPESRARYLKALLVNFRPPYFYCRVSAAETA